MQFEWDEKKRQSVIKERGVDMVEAALIFEGPVLTKPDDRRDYGEIRLISLGMVDDDCFVVVYTKRNGSIRLERIPKSVKQFSDKMRVKTKS